MVKGKEIIMEEKKQEGKTIKMDTARKAESPEKKISYEDLQKAAGQLYQQNQVLQNRLKEYEEQMQRLNNIEVRLHYLFEVLDKGSYFDNEFIDSVVEEVKTILTIDGNNGEEEEEKTEE